MLFCRFVVSGLVQGVGYRYFASRAARELGLKGFVRNLPDGTVEAVAAGDSVGMAEFEKRLTQGPPGSRVDSVEKQDHSRDIQASDFTICQ